MAGLDEAGRTILRNRLIGRWVAERLGLSATEAEAYSQAFAVAANTPAGSDVFGSIRRDFDAAGVEIPDDQILAAITDLTVRAGAVGAGQPRGLSDGAAFAIKRHLTTR
jgi:hypothetical protein